jgi:hypothetical protein
VAIAGLVQERRDPGATDDGPAAPVQAFQHLLGLLDPTALHRIDLVTQTVDRQTDVQRVEGCPDYLFGPQAPGHLVPAVPALHGVLGIENDHPAVHRPQHRFQVQTIAGGLLGLDPQLLVDRLHLLVAGTGLLVQRLQFLVGGLELLVGGLQLFVGGLELLVGGLEFLVGRLQLLNGIFQAFLGRLQFALQGIAWVVSVKASRTACGEPSGR